MFSIPKKKIPLIINDIRDMGESYYKPFRNVLGDCTENYKILEVSPDTISAVVFCGGSDVSPNLYNEGKSRLTYCDPHRDTFEVSIFRKAKLHKIPMIGVCRGAQFLCVMAGGKLYQHVSNHNGGNHYIQTVTGESIMVNSYHHQMLRPPEDAVIVGWCNPNKSDEYIGGNDQSIPGPDKEPEIVYFPNINAIGFQYHPEIMSSESAGFDLAGRMVRKYLLSSKS